MPREHDDWLAGIGVEVSRFPAAFNRKDDAEPSAPTSADPASNAEEGGAASVGARTNETPRDADASDSPVIDLGWAGEIDISTVGKSVQIGNSFTNNGPEAVAAGFGQGLLSVQDSRGSQIEGKFTAPSSADLDPGATSFTSTVVSLPAGVFNIRLDLLVNQKSVDSRIGALTVTVTDQSFGTSFLPGKRAPTTPIVPEDSDAIKLAWAGDITIDLVGNAVKISNFFQNNGPDAISAGFGQGLVNVFDSGGSSIEGKFAAPSSAALQPGGSSQTSVTMALAAGVFTVRMALILNSKVVDTRSGTLTIEATDQSFSTRFSPS